MNIKDCICGKVFTRTCSKSNMAFLQDYCVRRARLNIRAGHEERTEIHSVTSNRNSTRQATWSQLVSYEFATVQPVEDMCNDVCVRMCWSIKWEAGKKEDV